ncbi:MAG: tyrosine-type recombinase/integrase [Anaerolineae bacterium]|nr:tyrosine-type recombinase/integrase [Anaerolineae bacterium]
MQNFDLTTALPRRTASPNTQRAYYRWVDRYLADVAGLKETRGADRLKRMKNFPVRSMSKHLTPRKLTNWLNRLVKEGQGRQALDQARATIVTVADLLAEANIIETALASEIQAVSVPSIKKKETPERLLTPNEVKSIMSAAREMATSVNQKLRNNVIATMLCTMALRREELSAAKWGDLQIRDGGLVVLDMGQGGYVDMPRPVLAIIDRWRNIIGTPEAGSSLIRRIWKGGRVAKAGLSPDGIWLIIRNAADHANLGHVTPDDLRRSAVANMYNNGMPLEEISRLLRHRSVLITERFLSKLPIADESDE